MNTISKSVKIKLNRWIIFKSMACMCMAILGWNGVAQAEPDPAAPGVSDWIALTNHITMCYTSLNQRCEAAGVHVYFEPNFKGPNDDYIALAGHIESMCGSFVNQTKVDADGSFNTYLATGTPGQYVNQSLPKWNKADLLAAVGVSQWKVPLLRNVRLDPELRAQVVKALNLLKWAENRNVGPENCVLLNYSTPVTDEPLASWDGIPANFSQLAGVDSWIPDNSMWPFARSRYVEFGSMPPTYALALARCKARIALHNIPAVASCNRDLYVKGTPYFTGLDNSWNGGAFGILNGGYKRICATSTASTAPNQICSDFEGDAIEFHGNYNYVTEWCVGSAFWLLRWDLPDVPDPVTTWSENGDTDVDGIVDPGADLSGYTAGTGIITFRPDCDEAWVAIPFCAPPSWYQGVPMHAYLQQGFITNAFASLCVSPATYLKQRHPDKWNAFYKKYLENGDDDGLFQAFSFNTRVLATGSDLSSHIKQVALLRPNGVIVIFNFPWLSGEGKFSEVGYPTGRNEKRTYLLRDATPSRDDDFSYLLLFASGIVHKFGNIVDPNHVWDYFEDYVSSDNGSLGYNGWDWFIRDNRAGELQCVYDTSASGELLGFVDRISRNDMRDHTITEFPFASMSPLNDLAAGDSLAASGSLLNSSLPEAVPAFLEFWTPSLMWAQTYKYERWNAYWSTFSDPMPEFDFAHDSRFDVVWSRLDQAGNAAGFITSVAYTTPDGNESITTTISHDAKGRISRISKAGGLDGIDKTGVEISADGSGLTFGTSGASWMTESRVATADTGAARTWTVTRTVSGLGSLAVQQHYDAKDRLADEVVSVNGVAGGATVYEYNPQTGTYSTGLRKDANIAKITTPDGQVRTFHYNDSGWLDEQSEKIDETRFRKLRFGGYANRPYDVRPVPGSVSTEFAGVTISRKFPRGSGWEYASTASAEVGAPGNLVFGSGLPAPGWWYDGCGMGGLSEARSGLLAGLPDSTYVPWAPDGGYLPITYQVDADTLGLKWSAEVDDGCIRSGILHRNGVEIYSETKDKVSSGILSKSKSTTDSFGFVLRTDDLLGNTYTEVLSRNIYGPTSVRAVDGSIDTCEYYANGWVKWSQDGATGVKTAYEYDPMGNVTKTTITTASGAESITTEQRYDLRGRLVLSRDPLGDTSYNYLDTAFGSTVTITYPDLTSSIEDYYFDGTLKETRGAADPARVKVTYSTEVIDGSSVLCKQEIYPKLNEAGAVSESEWTKTYYNMLGLPFRIQRSGAVPAFVAIEYDKGRPYRQTDEKGVVSILNYDQRNAIEKMGIKVDGPDAAVLVPTSKDRITAFGSSVDAGGVITSTSSKYRTDGSGVATPIATSKVYAQDQGHKVEQIVDGKTTTTWLKNNTIGPQGTYTLCGTLPDGRTVQKKYAKWRLVCEELYAKNEVPDIVQPLTSTTYNYTDIGFMDNVAYAERGIVKSQEHYVKDDKWRVKEIQFLDGNGVATAAPIKLKYYTGTDLVEYETLSDGSTTHYQYWPNGSLKHQSDGVSMDLSFDYDWQGRRSLLTTKRGNTIATTKWYYYDASGLLQKKVDTRGTTVKSYNYNPDGTPDTQLDALNSTGKTTYDPKTGERTQFEYGNGNPKEASANVWARDGALLSESVGHLNGTTFAADLSCGYSYWDNGLPKDISISSGSSLVPNGSTHCTYDPEHLGPQLITETYGSLNRAFEVGYDNAVRVSSVKETVSTGAKLGVSYIYDNSGASFRVKDSTFLSGAQNVMTRTFNWDQTRGRMDNVQYKKPDGTVLASYTYTYKPDTDLIATMTMQDGARWTYDYDSKRHLTNAIFVDAGGTLGRQVSYDVDDLGNVTKITTGSGNFRLTDIFTTGDLNFQVQRVWGKDVEIIGNADPASVVTVNGVTASRNGKTFSALISVDRGSASTTADINVGALSGSTFAQASGKIFLPAETEVVTTALTGTAGDNSRFTYTFNWLEQLTDISSKTLNPAISVKCDYYPDGRRARKRVYEAGVLKRTHQFIYDDWNLSGEIITDSSGAVKTRTYLWALDLTGQHSGVLGQNAGGIGGLVGVRVKDTSGERTYYAISDSNGNIRRMIDETGKLAAEYTYSPYGAVAEWYAVDTLGSETAKNDLGNGGFRFSSKYYDAETELYYYGYRYYDPSTTKWISQDPLEEQGGVNLTAFCSGDPVNRVDFLGAEGVLSAYLSKNETYLKNQEQVARLNALEAVERSKIMAARSDRSWFEIMLYSDSSHGRYGHDTSVDQDEMKALVTKYDKLREPYVAVMDSITYEAKSKFWIDYEGGSVNSWNTIPIWYHQSGALGAHAVYSIGRKTDIYGEDQSFGESLLNGVSGGVELVGDATLLYSAGGAALGKLTGIRAAVPQLMKSPVNRQIGNGKLWGWVGDKYRGYRLRAWTRQAVREIDAAIAIGDRRALRAMGAGRKEARRLASGKDINNMCRGQVVHARVRQLAERRLGFASVVATGRGYYGPDFYNRITMRAWDVTTRKEWADHVLKYVVDPPLNPRTNILRQMWRHISPAIY